MLKDSFTKNIWLKVARESLIKMKHSATVVFNINVAFILIIYTDRSEILSIK